MKNIEIVETKISRPGNTFVTSEGITIFKQANNIFAGRLYVEGNRVLYKPHPMATVIYDLGSIDDDEVMTLILMSPNKEALEELRKYRE